MKLLGVTNDKIVVASMGRHDYVAKDGIMADGGQPELNDYGGYNRFSGKRVWFEVPQDFAELYNDYAAMNLETKRKYGIWDIADVKILNESEWPDTNSFSWKVENAIWGSRGRNNLDDLKYRLIKNLDTNHLLLIRDICSEDTRIIVNFWLNCRKDELDKLGIEKI